MTRDEIIRMAREAAEGDQDPFVSGWITMDNKELERFAALAAAAEREACALLCESKDPYVYSERTANACAAAIRARGQQ